MSTVSYESLEGPHWLSGYDETVVPASSEYDENAMRVRFILDGIVYEAQEDPSDGYRSSMGDLRIVTAEEDPHPVRNVFPPVAVIGRYDRGHADMWDEANDIIRFIDAVTDEEVLAIGTANTSDYYPSSVFHFSPAAMVTNQRDDLEEDYMDNHERPRRAAKEFDDA